MFIHLLLILLIFLLYKYATRNHDYWNIRNVQHDKPIPLFGNHFRNALGIASITQVANELYRKYSNEKIVGYYRGNTPELLIRDLTIIKHVLNSDFAHFYRRGYGRDVELEPLSGSLFHAEGDLWKLLRHRLTPAFTVHKVKHMFPLIVNCSRKLQNKCENIVAKGGYCDIKDLMARFSTELIGACGLGIDMDTINNEKSRFRELGKNIFERSIVTTLKIAMYELFPEFEGYIHIGSKNVEDTLINIVKKICENRNGKPSGRNDFIDLLLELENNKILDGDSIEKFNADETPDRVQIEMDLKLMAAQVYVFFGAGFETSSSGTSFMLHQLAFDPEIQTEIQNEIDTVLSRYDNKLCYDAISEMKLLEMAFKESMRLFPAAGVLNRVCTKKYKIPGTDVTIDKGVKIIIPVQATHLDEKYYELPDEFRPERFSPKNSRKIDKFSYLPFGAGPRACIGARLGLIQSLAGLVAILQNFTLVPSKETYYDVITDPRVNVVLYAKKLPLKLKRRLKRKHSEYSIDPKVTI